MSEQPVNTVKNSRPGPFQKGDPRINRKGRPRTFQKLRNLAQQLGSEMAVGPKGDEVIIKGHIATQTEMILRDMMHANPERYLEIAYGKVPQPIEHIGEGGGAVVIRVIREDKKSVNVPGQAPDIASEASSNQSQSSQAQDNTGGTPGRQNNCGG